MCVQRFDDSRNSAIHITYRISLRSSSMPEPRDPLLKVLFHFAIHSDDTIFTGVQGVPRRARARGAWVRSPGGHPASGGDGPAEATEGKVDTGGRSRETPRLSTLPLGTVMILPQVHLRNSVTYVRLGGQAVTHSLMFPPGPDYILSTPAGGRTHFHLVCERSPYLRPPQEGGMRP